MNERLRKLMIEWWPDHCPGWPTDTWHAWREELGRYTEHEIESALRIYMKQGSPFPPTWGTIYQLAKPMRRARMDRIAEHRYHAALEQERER